MSRVHIGQKHVNMPKHTKEFLKGSKVKLIHGEHEDYTKAPSIKSWLFIKYDMDFDDFLKQPIDYQEKLRKECCKDTGRKYRKKKRKTN